MTSFSPSRPFAPLPGTSNPHAQTLLGQFLRPLQPPPLRRVRWDTPDGDFIDADLLEAPPDAPHLLILHGLEGSSKSGYVVAILRHAKALGWGALAMNFRSCSGEPNRIARSYCSGESDDPRFIVQRWRERGVTGPLFGVGFSLGANVLLKMLAEDGEASPLKAAVAISAPFDLVACARALDGGTGVGRLYREVFVRALKVKALQKAKLFPDSVDADRVRAATTITAFDDAVTAPLYGYRDAQDYYAQCSSGRMLGKIRRPTLLISSKDDPITPLNGEPDREKDNPFVQWLLTDRGGHVGFISAGTGRPHFWAEATAAEFLQAQLAR